MVGKPVAAHHKLGSAGREEKARTNDTCPHAFSVKRLMIMFIAQKLMVIANEDELLRARQMARM